ncbi:MAG TPA: STAS/SEC14 domain-containing protein [Chthoniobacter sp.]|jgi:hypothetical protein
MYYTLSGEGQLLEITVGDGLTKKQILEVWDAIEAHPIYHQAVAGLVVFGRDTTWTVSGSDMAELGRTVRRLRPLHWAFVAQDPLSFGMTRMFASHAEGDGEYQTFDSENSAREWLQGFLS